ncbi:hypothetical protein BGZ61DRAFT_457579 [Ilyonectria robusta]|uniref:uncharacterized protein n=1 Tax=Ilyonectria robusta TaxID=1079257 RepID=UPI001E8CA633|nr:uncharacterized protein BGZ61DRAFT_457579 [Ilyonectria robusta]KAH8677084.1 hypothetical protein BGZ61DRAFT_457579 [Ilyonectria robusta]
MSQYGSGFGPPQGYQPPDAYSHAPPPAYTAPPYQSSETAQTQHPGHGRVTLESYEYNRQAIPGLGLNFSNNAVNWQQAWANGAPQPEAERPQAGPTERIPTIEHVVRSPPAIQTRLTANRVADNTAEEGELSEGELEDIYEPGQVEEQASGRPPSNGLPLLPTASSLRHPGEVPSQPQTYRAVGKEASTARYWDPEQSARERSGSYSPYLSPREIHSNDQANSPSDGIDTPRSQMNEDRVEISVSTKSMHVDQTERQPGLMEESTNRSIDEAKRRAQDAILRLWPLNIRYQNYLDEGIDRQLLDGLFTELGLDSTRTKAIAELPTTSPPIQRKEPPKEIPHVQDDGKESDHANGHLDRATKPKDKSEERKDRIARLLAAKGSKSAVAIPEVAVPGVAVPEITTVRVPPTAPSAMLPNKTQSEKSKLIQQKMEALKKSRANKTAHTEGSATPATDNNVVKPPALSSAPGLDNVPGPSASAIMVDQPPATLERSESHGAPSIPGLFLSSTPQASPVVNQRKRPVAADLNENSASNAHKRPFGQNRESRPFLIDVSDDEDDAEMEIDSPELRPSSIHRPTTPTEKTASFRDHPALSDNLSHRQLSSPKAVSTPTGQGSSGSSMYDLESMNKKIEDMKRKIAEAEARKKAKLSSNGTPSVPQSQVQSKEGSVDTTHIALPTPGVMTPSGTDAEEDGRSTPLPSQPTPEQSRKLGKVRGQKGQTKSPLRSRAASARLPVLEAYRSEQTRQLKHLQSEVARIEKEIQASLQEEERLREEVIESEPDAESQDDSELEDLSTEPHIGPQSTDSHLEHSIETINRVLPTNEKLESHGSSSRENPNVSTDARTHDQVVDVTGGQGIDEETGYMRHDSVADYTAASPEDALAPVDGTSAAGEDAQSGEISSDPETDVAMEEDADSSSEEDNGGSLDGYEPTVAGVEIPNAQSPAKSASWSPPPPGEDAVLETSDTDLQGVSATSPVTQPISAADGGSASVSESGREVDLLHNEELTRTLTLKQVEQATEVSDSGASKSTFAPYETPLQYFRAYRFHPKFKDSIAGGLRSLTYSNKIDVKREVCPDQLAGAVCPRGNQCEFQHFENMKAPDDQILLQLGAYGNYEGEQKQKYITGLRDLLTGFRNRKIKDFQAISEGIIEYRAQFHGDKTKILPLGSVSI